MVFATRETGQDKESAYSTEGKEWWLAGRYAVLDVLVQFE
jgi:hypothetical protein